MHLSNLGCCPFLGRGSAVVDLLLTVTPVAGVEIVVCLYMLLYVHSSFAIILMGKRELIALLGLSS